MKMHAFTFAFIGLFAGLMTTVQAEDLRVLQMHGQEELVFETPVERVAIGNTDRMDYTVLSNKQVLIQAKDEPGTVSVLIWFKDGTRKHYDYRIEPYLYQMEDRIREAIADLGQNIEVKRIQRGDSPNDEEDVFVFSGKVDHQVDLIRILSLASRVLTGGGRDQTELLQVIADEGGTLLDRRNRLNNQLAETSSIQSPFAANTGQPRGITRLGNNITANLARSKVIEAADGRIVSFIEVEDIPRVRITVRLYSVDRDKLRSYGSGVQAITSDFSQQRLRSASFPVQFGNGPQFGSPVTIGKLPDIQNIFSLIGGGFANQTQLSTSRLALDTLFSVLESEDIAHSLSEPTMSVLSGETAIFRVGGEVPFRVATATAVNVFQAIEFAEFGVQLTVRPLVDENDRIVLDIAPSVSVPVPNTVSTVDEAPAFSTKFIKTTARLKDGQAMIVGGLIERNETQDVASTPGLNKVPIIKDLSSSNLYTNSDSELVIIVTPTIERDVSPRLPLWVFPEVKLP